MNALFVASTLRLGGAERVTGEVTRRLTSHGIEATWALLREPGREGLRLREAGMELLDGLGPGRFSPAAALRLRRLIRHRRVAAVYALDHQNAVVATALAASMARVPRRFMAVHTTGLWGGRPSLPFGVRAVLPHYSRIVAVAEAQARYLAEREGVPGERICVIPNGVDIERFTPSPERSARGRALAAELTGSAGGPLLGVVAALRPEKGHRVLLEALPALRRRYPGLSVAFVGEGAERAALEARAGELELTGAVHFLGARDDIADLLAAFDVVVLPSLPEVETLPLALIEAMAAGRPVVATPVGSVGELIEDGAGGFLVPPGDAAALTAALDRLLADDGLRAAFAAKGLATAARYDIRVTVARTAALLKGEIP